jgi:alpha-L-fucosidase
VGLSHGAEKEEGPFEPDWESMKSYRCPEWLRDAKFGIFLHWGINSVPGYDGHYGRHMYWQEKPDPTEGTGWTEKSGEVCKHHVKTYGHPTKFGYKDFIPMWKAEKFDADELAQFFKSIGARYVVPMAVHHDNFDNWNSKHHRWKWVPSVTSLASGRRRAANMNSSLECHYTSMVYKRTSSSMAWPTPKGP